MFIIRVKQDAGASHRKRDVLGLMGNVIQRPFGYHDSSLNKKLLLNLFIQPLVLKVNCFFFLYNYYVIYNYSFIHFLLLVMVRVAVATG